MEVPNKFVVLFLISHLVFLTALTAEGQASQWEKIMQPVLLIGFSEFQIYVCLFRCETLCLRCSACLEKSHTYHSQTGLPHMAQRIISTHFVRLNQSQTVEKKRVHH